MNKLMNCFFSIFFFISSCMNTDTVVNQDNMNGFDFRLYQNTPAWILAKATEKEDTDGIRDEIGKNKSLLSFREPKFGQTMLQLAVKTEKYKSVETLLDLGADPNMQDKYDGSSPMMESAKIYNETTGGPDSRYLKLLLKHGGDPNAEEKTPRRIGNGSRNTPLLNACSSGVLEYVKILVDAGANVNYANKFGENIVYRAISSRNPDIVIYLLEKGADFRGPMAVFGPANLGGIYMKSRSVYISDALRGWLFPLGSVKYQKKMQIVDFLKKQGIDYRSSKIPAFLYRQYDKSYLDKY